MYGTVARIQVKPGMEREFIAYGERRQQEAFPGMVAVFIYQSDRNPREFWLAVVSEDEDSYRANAEDPRTNEQFMEMMQYLAAEPEWHDGQVIFGQFG